MISFFKKSDGNYYAVETATPVTSESCEKLQWLFGGAELCDSEKIDGKFIGPRREMITPWSTNAVEITQNMGMEGISRIEEYIQDNGGAFDPMLQRKYDGLDQDIFKVDKTPDPIVYIDDIESYNQSEGLALSPREVEYLKEVEQKLGRKLTDSEVFGFSQVNSEHCRHKIFNGQYIIDGEEKELSLFKLIKKTSEENPNRLVSAYKDNVAFNKGPEIMQFAPKSGDTSDFFELKKIKSVLSLKAETHNFPTTVEPFNGAATGTGGEIRDRLGGGKASLPLAGTAVYMTSYTRNDHRSWEESIKERNWLYQTPEQILVKASNGASDFGNKYGQPMICGSLLTFEHDEKERIYGFDKVIMLAGGVGYTNSRDALKEDPVPGEKVVVMGGDNYRIGMGGGAVSSVDTGKYSNAIELNAVQRANPEMQKRVANVIRSLQESDDNPIVSIHDHGAGGHLNCLSELVESTGGRIDMAKLPIGDKTLSDKEIIGNESQERMGMLITDENIARVKAIADRERAPMYVVGETTGDMNFVFEDKDGNKPIDIKLEYMIGKPPRTVIRDNSVEQKFEDAPTSPKDMDTYLRNVLSTEAVACKDWLTNKVDRSVTGKVARQQCAGELQLPLSDCGAVALDYTGTKGIATSIGHAPMAGLVSAPAGSVLSIAEALTNLVFAPLDGGLESVSLSANWMWPCKNEGEDARLYSAVEACSNFAIELGVNIPTGKDSLSMTQKYGENKVMAPGTVIISAAGEVSDIRKIVSPVVVNDPKTDIYYIDFSFHKMCLGGSVLYQTLGKIGSEAPDVANSEYFVSAFNAVQKLIKEGYVLAGHDISAGGLVTCLLEMCFANTTGGLNVNLSGIAEPDMVKVLFAENPGVCLQVRHKENVEKILNEAGVAYAKIAYPATGNRNMRIRKDGTELNFDIDGLRDIWYRPSYLLDCKQSGETCAKARFENYKNQKLDLYLKQAFRGNMAAYGIRTPHPASGVKAAIIREKGTNGEREMAYAIYLAGFDVKDVHMTDLASGRETLEDISMIVFCGGFSNSDVLGSAKGWAGVFRYNEKAKTALEKFYARKDTLSLGICNGCQLMIELGLVNPDHDEKPRMLHNDSHKFESSFVGVDIPKNDSVMFGSLGGSRLGIWVAHGEGKFHLPKAENEYRIVAKYHYSGYPGNPNGSDYDVAGICSSDGRHLAMMPHLERAIFPWQWAYYPEGRNDEVSPWIEAFVNARKWIENAR